MQNIPKWLVQSIAGLLAVLLLVVSVSQIFAARNHARQANDKHTINISAEGKVASKPDLITVTAGVQNDGATAAIAQAENAKKINAATDFLKNKIGINSEDIRTENYSIYQKQDYIGGKTIPSGYTANQTLVIKIHDLDKLTGVLSGLTESGINQIQNVSYSINDPESLKQKAREQALASAKEKAQKLAEAAGVKLGRLVSFSESNISGGPIFYSDAAKNMSSGGGGPQLEPGSQDVVAQVNVTYEIK